jgi:hypothetical protein
LGERNYRGGQVETSRIGGYARALLAAVMIVVGLVLFTIAMAAVIGPPT